MKKIILFVFAFVALTATFTCCEKSVVDEYDGTRAFEDSTTHNGVTLNFDTTKNEGIEINF